MVKTWWLVRWDGVRRKTVLKATQFLAWMLLRWRCQLTLLMQWKQNLPFIFLEKNKNERTQRVILSVSFKQLFLWGELPLALRHSVFIFSLSPGTLRVRNFHRKSPSLRPQLTLILFSLSFSLLLSTFWVEIAGIVLLPTTCDICIKSWLFFSFTDPFYDPFLSRFSELLESVSPCSTLKVMLFRDCYQN